MAKKKQVSNKKDGVDILPHHQEQSQRLQEIEEEIVRAETRKAKLQTEITVLQDERAELERKNAELISAIHRREEQSKAHHERLMPKLETILAKVKSL